jgi:hypothetical protein
MEAARADPAVLERLRERIRTLQAAPRQLLSVLRTGLAPVDALLPGEGFRWARSSSSGESPPPDAPGSPSGHRRGSPGPATRRLGGRSARALCARLASARRPAGAAPRRPATRAEAAGLERAPAAPEWRLRRGGPGPDPHGRPAVAARVAPAGRGGHPERGTAPAPHASGGACGRDSAAPRLRRRTRRDARRGGAQPSGRGLAGGGGPRGSCSPGRTLRRRRRQPWAGRATRPEPPSMPFRRVRACTVRDGLVGIQGQRPGRDLPLPSFAQALGVGS